jgi:predicted DNA-binding protein with PD1-like motif
MRRIEHPGPVGLQRVQVADGWTQAQTWDLPAGLSLRKALAQLAQPSAHSAVLQLQGGGFESLAYAMPALSKSPAHAVYFSDRHLAEGPVQLIAATVTMGQREGEAWLHCHARWTDSQGRIACGHLLPDEAVLAPGMRALAHVMAGAGFEVSADAETGFSLFQPVATSGWVPSPSARKAWVVRLSPNEDVCTALEQLCVQRGVQSAMVRGGVGSTVGAVFDDGRQVLPFVTETLIRRGRIAPDASGQPVAMIDVSMVDYTGGLAEGRLARGQNPVLVTFELVIEPD